MLETIRSFAETERIDEDHPQAEAVRHAHASWFAEWTQARSAELTGPERDAAVERMLIDIGNVRTAWRHCVSKQKDVEQLEATDSLWYVYDEKGWYHATVALTTDLLDVLGSTPSTPDRIVEEITLQTSLAGTVLMVIRGVTQEVEDTLHHRALELCEGTVTMPRAAARPPRALELLRVPVQHEGRRVGRAASRPRRTP